MTDNEMIKTLEYRIKYSLDIDFSKDMLDLINRQKAEIERLEKARQRQAKFLGEERGQKYDLLNKIGKAKSEAIKEFAEQLRKRFYFIDGHCVVDIPQINNLVKKMTENDFKE